MNQTTDMVHPPMDPRAMGEDLSNQVADAAHRLHPEDHSAGAKFIKETIAGNTTWSDAVRGMAHCKYSIKLIDGKTK